MWLYTHTAHQDKIVQYPDNLSSQTEAAIP